MCIRDRLYSHLMTRARVRTDLDVLRLAFSRCCGKSTTPTSSSSARSLLHSVILPLTSTNFLSMAYYRLEDTANTNRPWKGFFGYNTPKPKSIWTQLGIVRNDSGVSHKQFGRNRPMGSTKRRQNVFFSGSCINTVRLEFCRHQNTRFLFFFG